MAKEEIIRELSRAFNRDRSIIEAIIESQDTAIVRAIETNDPMWNVKLDYLGKFESNPYRRAKMDEITGPITKENNETV